MRRSRKIALYLLVLPALILLWYVQQWVAGAPPSMLIEVVIGEIWYSLAPDSLELLQPAIERHLHPGLWEFVVQPLLLLPAFPIACLPATIAFLLSLRKKKRRRR